MKSEQHAGFTDMGLLADEVEMHVAGDDAGNGAYRPMPLDPRMVAPLESGEETNVSPSRELTDVKQVAFLNLDSPEYSQSQSQAMPSTLIRKFRAHARTVTMPDRFQLRRASRTANESLTEVYDQMSGATFAAKDDCLRCGKNMWRILEMNEVDLRCTRCDRPALEICSGMVFRSSISSPRNASSPFCGFRMCGRCLFSSRGDAERRIFERILQEEHRYRRTGRKDLRLLRLLGHEFQAIQKTRRRMLLQGTTRRTRVPLHRAIQLGQLALVLQILKERAVKCISVDDLSEGAPGWSPGWHETPLMTAVQAFHLPADLQLGIVKALLEHGASLQTKDSRGRLPITLAVMAAPGAARRRWHGKPGDGVPPGAKVLCQIGAGNTERWCPAVVVARRERMTVLQAAAIAPRDRLRGFGPRFVHNIQLSDGSMREAVPLQCITLDEPPDARQLDMGSRVLYRTPDSVDWYVASVVDFSRKGESRFDIEVRLPPRQFATGDRVEVRDRGDTVWRIGSVTSTETEPPLVQVEGWEQSFVWDEMRKYGADGVTIASSSGSIPGCGAENVLLERNNFWETPRSVAEHWFVLDAGHATTVRELFITHGGGDLAPSKCELQVSPAELSGPWRTVLAFNTARVSSNQSFKLPRQSHARYFRLVVKTTH
eukprot:Hpha_TRINITY_DN35281_c0_g1::TRINITY_DN35281_c0_g1_i1::g.145119::m.145119